MIRIAESEWIIMKQLWASSPLTSRQIINNITDCTNWNDKTVHTLISRLCKKGAINAVRENGSYSYMYYAAISEEECIREETRSFIERIYSGSIKNLISAFVKDNEMSKEDISELRDFLDEIGRDDKKWQIS